MQNVSKAYKQSSFNTTLVKVLSTFVSIPLYSSIGFNTTLVKVLSYKQQSKVLHTIVSIQLLLRFYTEMVGTVWWV